MALDSQSSGSQKKELRSILVIGHPGHELRVHNWLETARPEVWVLTDGSGRSQTSRIDSTTHVLDKVGARPGPAYGYMRDVDVYDDVLHLNHDPFIQLVHQLTNALIEGQIDVIAGDAQEGYNPTHDICRLVINSAVELVKRKRGKPIVNYDFALVGPPHRGPADLLDSARCLTLDDRAFARKIEAARNYPELQAEVEGALNATVNENLRENDELSQRLRSTFGVTDANSFRVECLRPVNNITSTDPFNGDIPFYEAYGEKQVKAGLYQQVLRYREHMQPLAAALWAQVEANSDRT